MTLTPAQLDELEAKLRDPCEYPHGIGTDASRHLIAVYRAALACNNARRAYVKACDELEDSGSPTARIASVQALNAYDRARTALDAALQGTP